MTAHTRMQRAINAAWESYLAEYLAGELARFIRRAFPAQIRSE